MRPFALELLRRCLCLGLCLLALAGAGAGPAAAQAVSVTDDRGHTLTLVAPAQRIVSLLPSLTESVCALDACSRLVGVDRHSNWPAAVQSLPQLGGLNDTPIEALVRLQPDLVLLTDAHRTADRLRTLGLAVLVLDPKTHADVRRHLGLLAVALGQPARADALWAHITQQQQRAAQALQPHWRGQTVYFEVASAPYAAGPGSFVGETLAQLGLGNIVPPGMGAFPKLNPEFILRAQPQVVMLQQRDAATIAQRPGLAHLRALQAQQVCAFAPPAWDVLVRPGPRLGEAAQLMVECLNRLQRPINKR